MFPTRLKLFRLIARNELMFAGVCLSFPLLLWSFQQKISVTCFLAEWFFSWVYANCIGWPLSLLMPGVFGSTERLIPPFRWLLRASVVVLLTCTGCLIAALLPKLLFPAQSYWHNFKWSFGISLMIALISTAVISALEELHERLRATELQLRTKELERERALKLATEARLASLESRIHPHFLFNTINSVSSLIHDSPDEAERLLLQMASLLRFSLDSGHVGLVPLEREMKIVKDYLDIEKARFNGRLRYDISIHKQVETASVPPLAIQTLVENSVKYAVTPRREGANIRVRAEFESQRVLLEVSDDGPGFTTAELPAGHGLSNLKERLHALYGEKASFDVGNAAPGSYVRLVLPVNA